MARNALLAIGLIAALALAGCAGQDDQDEAQAAQAQLAALRAHHDSVRQARALRPAADTAADTAARSTLAATTPALDSTGRGPGADSSSADSAKADTVALDPAVADSVRRAREIEVMRETFAYAGGTRDPFASLINADATGPEFADLELVGVYQDLRYADNSLVVLREKVTLKRHKMRVGDQVGRARLVQIRPKDAVFRIQDFGFERQETLSLRKQEVETP